MTENDSTDGARPVKSKRRRVRATMVRGEVYSSVELAAAGFDDKRIAAWKELGLTPLPWGTRCEHFRSDDIIDLPSKPPKKGPPK